MKKVLLLCIASAMYLMGFSSPSSVSDNGSKINYFGTINGQEVENITISGLTDHIYFYNKPNLDNVSDIENIDPKHDRTEKSLADIKSIKLPHDKRIFSKYRNQEYIEVVVTDKNGDTHTYLVEKNRMVSGKLPKAAGKRDVFFDALHSVDIKGEICGGKPTTF